jgi:hypothetical protein
VSGKSIFSAVVEILEKSQQVLGNRFFGDRIEYGSNLPADMSLEGG